MLTLYGYWRSSAAYRVRIALNLKQLPHQHKSIHLVKDGGQQHSAQYKQLNPNELVPTLVDGDMVINQSLAIIDYLDEKYPKVPLYPSDLTGRTAVKALAYDIACDIHPLNNLRVLQYLSQSMGVSDQQKSDWYCHWIEQGFSALEQRLSQCAGKFCYRDTPSVADLCLIPQIYNAKRFNVDMSAYPTITRIAENCASLQAFIDAEPEQQADANS
ncbi:maleylacetoacetate isomerase [Thalassotalea ponticola]|uniref:maleylacetoacetate isomerase n=1 Tax=Thalassotalea ponticola TaxID=1523392 RepID=UPI0025B29E47|nr:maleylacetoacetate isomerase [Thalassotalea ponticola]MDN3653179.1 maleylacetoacetate isomerase [Thalassotalea ponticola]